LSDVITMHYASASVLVVWRPIASYPYV
jgi:hypothetical protein